jgi:hypothetical protein
VEQVQKFFNSVLQYGFTTYKDFILGLLIGLTVAWMYHKWIGNRDLKRSYEKLLSSKDETINALKEIIGGRLAAMQVTTDKDFFNRVKKYFRLGRKQQQSKNKDV